MDSSLENKHYSSPGPILEYPRCLYTGGFVYRSAKGFFIAAVTALGAGAFIFIPNYNIQPHDRRFTVLFCLGGGLFALVALKIIYGILNDSREIFRLTTTGIEVRGKTTPWSKVHQFAAHGKESDQAISLCYTIELAPGFTTTHELQSSSRIPRAEYDDLISQLKLELSTSYPDLKLGGYVKVAG